MNLIDYHRNLEKLDRSVFHVKEAAAAWGIGSAYASQILKRLQAKDRVKCLRHGIWAMSENVDPFLAPEALSFPFKSYLSLQTALFHHGMIEQIPEVIYAITLGRTKKLETAIGAYSFHHLDAKFFFGYERLGDSRYPMATPEKALFDFLYLSYGKSKYFKGLPEFECPKNFDKKLILSWIKQVEHQTRREQMRSFLERLQIQNKRRMKEK